MRKIVLGIIVVLMAFTLPNRWLTLIQAIAGLCLLTQGVRRVDWFEFYLCYWRRYAGWFPVQRCMTCGWMYWGGLPRYWFHRVPLVDWQRDEKGTPTGGKVKMKLSFGCTWQASWMDYCSQKCCDEDPSVPPPMCDCAMSK